MDEPEPAEIVVQVPLVDIWLHNANRTRDGQHGPGHVRVPQDEAGYFLERRMATPGDRPPAVSQSGLRGR
jgi:hypothetical protein